MYKTGACHWLLRVACCWYIPEVSSASSDVVDHGHGYRSSRPWLERVPVVTAPTAQELTVGTSLPDKFDWRNVNGRSFVTTDLNQHIPIYCGACWIHGTVHALNDRIKVMRDGRYPEVLLSRQAIMNCVPDPTSQGPPPGCNGGDPWMIHAYLHEHKVPDESCMPYAAVNMECTPMNVCRNCARGTPTPENLYPPGPCFAITSFLGYGVRNYGNLSGEAAMMKEIYARGPITCRAVTTPDFMHNFTQNKGLQKDGIFDDETKYTEADIDHFMEVAGWGVSALGTRFWVVRNSWGTYWGDAGWFKIVRGVNSLLIESSCDWAVPDAGDIDQELKNRVMGDYFKGLPSPQSALEAPHNNVKLAMMPTADGKFVQGLQALLPAACGAIAGAALMWVIPRFLQRAHSPRQPYLLG